jgi:hypothetical protein
MELFSEINNAAKCTPPRNYNAHKQSNYNMRGTPFIVYREGKVAMLPVLMAGDQKKAPLTTSLCINKWHS